jgi:hypothetical protein
VSSDPVHGEMYSIQHYVIKFVSDLRQVCGFLRVLQFPPSIKLSITIVGDSVIPSTPNGKNDTRSDDGGKTFIC